MKIQLTVGVLRNWPEHKKPITVEYVGSTAHWPTNTFDRYLWYRAEITIPANFGKPKVTAWRLIVQQETKGD